VKRLIRRLYSTEVYADQSSNLDLLFIGRRSPLQGIREKRRVAFLEFHLSLSLCVFPKNVPFMCPSDPSQNISRFDLPHRPRNPPVLDDAGECKGGATFPVAHPSYCS
jgi:hypothetical protein